MKMILQKKGEIHRKGRKGRKGKTGKTGKAGANAIAESSTKIPTEVPALDSFYFSFAPLASFAVKSCYAPATVLSVLFLLLVC